MRKPLLALAALVALAAPASADAYRYVFAVEGEAAQEETVRSENSGAAARGPTTVWNSIDTRAPRGLDPATPTPADLAAAPTAEVSVEAGSHLRRSASRVLADPRFGPGAAKLSMTQFMNNTGMAKPRADVAGKPPGPDNNSPIEDPAAEGKPKRDGGGAGSEDRFWEATPTGKSLNELYNEILGRNIDPSGYKTYGELVDLKGTKLEEIRKILLESEEYKKKHPEGPPVENPPQPNE